MLRSAARSSFKLISFSKIANVYPGSQLVLRSQQYAPKYSTCAKTLGGDSTKKLFFKMMTRKQLLISSKNMSSSIDDKSTLPTPRSSAEWEKHQLVHDVRDNDGFWMDNMRQLENVITDHVLYIENTPEYANFLADVSNRRSLIMLGPILFLRFRINARKVLEQHLSKKVSQVLEEDKGSNFVKNCGNIDRIVDYNFFLEQLDEDIKRGHLDAFFKENEFEFVEEFYEICEYALFGERKLYASARPNDIYYIQEEISCDIRFPAPLDRHLMCRHIDTIICKSTQEKCHRILFYLEKLISISK